MKEKYRKPQISTVGLVAHYKLWAGLTDGSTVFDYSLGGFVATLTGTDIAPAYPGFVFNGTDDFIGIVTGPTGVKTVLAWVNPTDVAGIDAVLDYNGTDSLVSDTGTLSLGGFAGGSQVTYVDGVAGATVTAVWHLVGITDTVGRNIALATIGLEGANFFAGFIGETMCFDRVLTAPDVKSIYELTKWRYQ